MDLYKISYPSTKEHYLKEIISKKEVDAKATAGTVFLKKGKILPMKTLPDHEISILVSGKLKVYNAGGKEHYMHSGDFIYISKDELRETEVLEDSQLIYFLYRGIVTDECKTEL